MNNKTTIILVMGIVIIALVGTVSYLLVGKNNNLSKIENVKYNQNNADLSNSQMPANNLNQQATTQQPANKQMVGENKKISTVKDGQKKVTIVSDGNVNQVIYTDQNNKEHIVAKGKINTEHGIDDIVFQNAAFSPQKNYIIYEYQAYEAGGMSIYDTRKKVVLRKDSEGKIIPPVHKEFTTDEKYLIVCGRGRSFPHAKVYLMPGVKKVFDVFGDGHDGYPEGVYGTDFYNGYEIKTCNYDKVNNIFKVELKKERLVGDKYEVVDTKVLKFELK